MMFRSSPAAPDRLLARLAGACLGGSMVAAAFFFGLVFFAAAPSRWTLARLLSLISLAVGVAAFVVSTAALSQLARRAVANPRKLWITSLVSNAVIVALVVAAVDFQLALFVCIPELVGITIHAIALGKQRSRSHGV